MFISKRKLELYMASNCMTYEELSRKSNISRFTILKMVSNKVDTRPVTVGKIAKALGVEVEKLIEDTAATVNQSIQDS